jgi:nucleoside-triphosphatase
MHAADIYILSGPINSGKTSLLLEWKNGVNCSGILTPKIDGKRMFMNVATEELFPMEADDSEPVFKTGKYKFSRINFDRAVTILKEEYDDENTEWLIIDEIGPLELNGEGFSPILKRIISGHRKLKLVLVVREGLVQDVVSAFNIQAFSQFNG